MNILPKLSELWQSYAQLKFAALTYNLTDCKPSLVRWFMRRWPMWCIGKFRGIGKTSPKLFYLNLYCLPSMMCSWLHRCTRVHFGKVTYWRHGYKYKIYIALPGMLRSGQYLGGGGGGTMFLPNVVRITEWFSDWMTTQKLWNITPNLPNDYIKYTE